MQEQEIRDWCVTGEDHILGNVYHRPGHADGETIITSPVAQVRLIGEARIPMAITESGSKYWLGTPSRRFGLDKAEAFVRRLSTSVRPADAPRDPSWHATILPGLASSAENGPAVSGPTLVVACASCASVAVATLSDEVSSVNAAGGISIDDPCPACGGRLAARPGKYRLNDATGMLERVGHFEPQPETAEAGGQARLRIVRSAG